MFKIFKTPYMNADDGVDLGGGESLNNEGQGEDVDSHGEGAGEVDSQTNEKPKQDRDTNEQFKAARIAAERETRALSDRQNRFAKMYGYNTFEELEQAAQLQQYTNQGYSPAEAELIARLDNLEQRLMENVNKARITEEKAALKEQRYFKELEPEIDKVLSVNPNLNVEAVYKYIRGEKLDELLAKETAAAKQKTLNQIGSKQHLGTEGDGEGDVDSVNVPAETLQMYMDMGMSKKDAVAHYKKLYK
ncbi:MAG TPA: hypothetical protein PLY41_05500 [Acetomicrobium sp.]|nr:hypothetical protein [Acetomicrobium sp.]